MILLDPPDYNLDHATWRLVAATWGLVIGTGVLVLGAVGTFLYGFLRDRKQDAERKKEAEPKALIELATYEDDPLKMAFVVYNLGNNTFVIDRLVVKGITTTVDAPQQTQIVLTPGTWVAIKFEPRLILGMCGSNGTRTEDGYGTAVLKGAAGAIEVNSGWFHVFYANASNPIRFPWSMGRAGLPPGTIVEPPRILPSGHDM